MLSGISGVTEFPVSTYPGPNPGTIVAGPDGNLWFTDNANQAVGVAILSTTPMAIVQQSPAVISPDLSKAASVPVDARSTLATPNPALVSLVFESADFLDSKRAKKHVDTA